MSVIRNQIWQFVTVIIFTIVVLFIVTSVTTLVRYSPYTESQNKLLNYKKEGIALLDRSGEEFYSTQTRSGEEFVRLGEISDDFEHAVLIAEDKKFYSHNGVSVAGIVRSIMLNIQEGRLAYGGSTLSQQLIKNTLLTPERTFSRKYQELLLTLIVERRYSKDEILAMYLNSVYFGEGAYGIAAASETYFGKDPSELTLVESSYLAGMLSAPSELNPYFAFDEGVVRQREILSEMQDEGYITEDEYERALSSELAFAAQEVGEEDAFALHFALYTISQLEKMYGGDVANQGLVVRTTLDPEVQQIATGAIQTQVERAATRGATNGAVVVMDADSGEVLALVGSVDWGDAQFGKYDMATAPRQVGSAFKPIVYGLALEEGVITTSTVLQDKPTTFDNPDHTDYRPKNYDRRYRGSVLVRQALAGSLNVPAVAVMERVGINSVVEHSDEFGISTITDPSDYGLSLVLGTGEVSLLEMTNAYTTFANGGQRPEKNVILQVKNKFGEEMYVDKKNTTSVLSPETAYFITSFLSDERARRSTFGNLLSFPFEVAVKTGTTEDFRDAWTIGYTPEYVVGVWVGNNDNTPMYNAPGSQTAAPAFRDVMTYMVHLQPEPDEFETPENVVAVAICRHNGLRVASASTSSAVMEYFIAGQEPTRECVLRPRDEDKEEDAEERGVDVATAEDDDALQVGGAGEGEFD